MSKIILKGAIQTILLLKTLPFEPEYMTSSEIYKKFSDKPATLLKRLNKMMKEGLTHGQPKKKMLPGGDKLEWCLRPDGQIFLRELMDTLKTGLIDKIIEELKSEVLEEIQEQLDEYISKELIDQLSSSIIELIQDKLIEN